LNLYSTCQNPSLLDCILWHFGRSLSSHL